LLNSDYLELSLDGKQEFFGNEQALRESKGGNGLFPFPNNSSPFDDSHGRSFSSFFQYIIRKT